MTTTTRLPRRLSRKSVWKVRFRPADARRKINKLGRVVDESPEAYWFRETDAAGVGKQTRDESRDLTTDHYFMVVKADAEVFKV